MNAPSTLSAPPARSSLWLYERLSRFGFLNYRAKVMGAALIGASLPLLAVAGWFALQSSPDWQVLALAIGATLAGTSFTLFALNQLLQPVLLTSQALRSYREHGARPPLPVHLRDEAGTLMADAQRTLEHLETRAGAVENIDPATGLPNVLRLLPQLDARVARGGAFAVVVLRFSNLRRIADTMARGEDEAAARLLAQRLRACPEFGENLSRVSPTEFAFTVNAPAGGAKPWVDVTARVRAVLAECAGEMQLGGETVQPLLHGGVAVFPADGDSIGDVLDHALAASAQAARTLEPLRVSLHAGAAGVVALQRPGAQGTPRRAIDHDALVPH